MYVIVLIVGQAELSTQCKLLWPCIILLQHQSVLVKMRTFVRHTWFI